MTNTGIEHPEDTETLEHRQFHEDVGQGTQEQMLKDPQWNGIPPVGNKPILDKQKFLVLILLVFIVKIIIWSIYRYFTGSLDIFTNPTNGSENVYWAGMVAKPILQLCPVILLWWYVFREKGLPFRLTKKHLFSSIVFGCILGFIYYFVATGVMIGVFVFRASIKAPVLKILSSPSSVRVPSGNIIIEFPWDMAISESFIIFIMLFNYRRNRSKIALTHF